MSGSSLDGLDMALCQFNLSSGKWNYKILVAETVAFSPHIKNQLADISNLSPENFVSLDFQFGKYIGNEVNSFIQKHKIKEVDYIASHGHTAFHNPANGYTSQIGNGASIASETEISAVCDFRSTDIALGGEGAPLVPIGDKLLFNEYSYCLNLGGYSNISYEKDKFRIAFDICPVNKIINYLAQKRGEDIDKDGETAKHGTINSQLLQSLNNLDFYKRISPKSLDDNWFNNIFLNVLSQFDNTGVQDLLRTVYEHIAIQIRNVTNHTDNKTILVTGGGAHNNFLIERISSINQNALILPDKTLIDYKEALIFAFMGLLRIENKPNCLSSVTGAKKDTSSGVIYNV